MCAVQWIGADIKIIFSKCKYLLNRILFCFTICFEIAND